MAPDRFDELNTGFVQELFAEYLESPETVDPKWRELFDAGPAEVLEHHPLARRLRELYPDGARAGNGGPAAAPAPPAAAQDDLLLGAVAAAMSLVKAHRTHGHLAARLDPLGGDPPGDPALDPERLEPPLDPELQARVPAKVLRLHMEAETLAEALPRLRETYCGTIAYEIEHIGDHEQRVWLRNAVESGEFRRPLAADERKALLGRLSEVEGFESYLRRAFLGQKQFSIEGLDAMVPMLDEAIDLGAADGAKQVVIGMAHRGRLNVLAHTVGRDVADILREFEGERSLDAVTADLESGSGDVKYHLGADGMRQTPSGAVVVRLASNPSHLEYVGPVAEGETRARQTTHEPEGDRHDPSAALAVLIHGDAAFAGQGVVAETLNLQNLEGYTTGGTLHLIANNQVGFTTDPHEGRSTRYSSDLAKGYDSPIVHVNADDPEAAIAAIRLAMAFRARFRHDIVVDLVGYRRFGHNEGDEPSYTQPLMYKRIEEHPTVRALYARALVDEGLVTEEEAEALVAETQQRMRASHEELKASIGSRARHRERLIGRGADPQLVTAVRAERLVELNERLLTVPEGFRVHPKLVRAFERRREALGGEGGIDWAQAESLAFAALLGEGTPVRLTGQDTERGTFSHRHLVLHDYETGEKHAPIAHLPDAKATFEVYNSPLSENGALGFEYGYSVASPRALVLWEAQFGDFVNGAQVIVDQFIVSGLSKWGQSSRLTLMLPHGYEGNGPEHSSARLERFMQLAAQENMRIVNPSTAAQYFHVLRRQALHPKGRPLVLLTPKGLLRLKDTTSHLDDLTLGGFESIIDDPRLDPDAKRDVTRLVVCSGKVYYDVVGHDASASVDGVAVVRLEQLYPFPVAAYDELLARYPSLREVTWTQEEPQNMGAWRAIRHRLEEGLPAGIALRYVGRPWRASPSEGYPTAHMLEQDRIARESLGAF
ncbi:MAG TPA: 2-oxoglutarate dehydrogenase E1 component [Gaiellaceae bacterium]|nr:2-oxoglutarate dehydrogenase E1 component [Gaiellaceae bacterium]